MPACHDADLAIKMAAISSKPRPVVMYRSYKLCLRALLRDHQKIPFAFIVQLLSTWVLSLSTAAQVEVLAWKCISLHIMGAGAGSGLRRSAKRRAVPSSPKGANSAVPMLHFKLCCVFCISSCCSTYLADRTRAPPNTDVSLSSYQ